jgi:NTP pyrophosphatase (non-canonical NTP hydrolase)
MNFEQLRQNVLTWADDRRLLKVENHKNQALKMVSEVGELCDAIAKSDKEGIKDGIGDTLVTIIILAEQLDLNPLLCLEISYNEIKNRKGSTLNGTVIKGLNLS